MRRSIVFAMLLLVVSFALSVSLVTAQDTTRVVAPASDSSDASLTTDSSAADSLTPAERAARSFDERMQRAREQAVRRMLRPRLSVDDSLRTALLSERLNQREWLNRSYYMSAVDYFKFAPGYFTQRWQLTPGRSTVRPYGLDGDRLAYVNDFGAQHPFEHTMEPDGSFDLEDLPTALDDAVYILPGAVGMIFGTDQAVATLLTRSIDPPEKKPMSSFLLDKGNWGFSHTRGRYADEFADGRVVKLGIGYRVADGARLAAPNVPNAEDAYSYDGSLFFPVTALNGLQIDGHLYHRKAPYLIRPDSLDSYVNRDRFDRNLAVRYEMSNDSQTVRTDIGYRHLRQGSYLTVGYRARFNYTGHGVDLSRQWYSPRGLLLGKFSVDRLEYDNAFQKYVRHTSEFSLVWARPSKGSQLAVEIGGRYVEEIRLLPSAAILVQRETARFFLQGSVGYAERAPSQHELYLPFQQVQLYVVGQRRYADEGNSSLSPERQLTGSLHLELGAVGNALVIEAVGGGIYDGIEWERSLITVGVADAWLFRPGNTDITFATVSAVKRLRLGGFLNLSGGGSYFWRDYEFYHERPYEPDYQLFGGLELHHYWQSKLMHFWGYGEVQYVGPYTGYQGEELGQQAVFNAKASFSMGNFRFRLVWQNLLNVDYSTREAFNIPGRVVTWGFDWNFFD